MNNARYCIELFELILTLGIIFFSITNASLINSDVTSSFPGQLHLDPNHCPQLDVNTVRIYRNYVPIPEAVDLVFKQQEEIQKEDDRNIENILNKCVEKCCQSSAGCDLAQLSNRVCLHFRCKQAHRCSADNSIKKMDLKSLTQSYLVFVAPAEETRNRPKNRLNGKKDLNGVTNTQNPMDINQTTSSTIEDITTPSFIRLTVSVGDNRIVQLPENSIVVNAFVVPPGHDYKFQWTLSSHPESQQDIGTMQDQNTPVLKLTGLKKGTYSFKLNVDGTVNGTKAFGEALINITVLAPKRINEAPVVVIQPNNSVVKLPTKETILDGSSSLDDDKIVSYHWEPIQVPIGYQIPSDVDVNTATLQLRNLIAGLYLFNLTLKDSDNVTSSGVANLTVLKEIDYPPTAVAGADIIIHLPQDSVVLNGSASADDKGIVSWLWTRIQDGDDRMRANPVDMTGATTPFLHLSSLSSGVYKFELKVTDTANQTSTAETHVFVKPEENTKPQVNAGANQQVFMPLKEDVQLDGSGSKDASINGIVKWNWIQIQGPRKAKILKPNSAITKVIGLIPGVYCFNLTATNAKNLSDWATVNVTVTQSRNVPPVANGGGDQKVTCPCDLIILNGSKSYDDIDIVSYRWTREPNSLAGGIVLNGSDRLPILQLSDLAEGNYIFKLEVTDTNGSISSDIVSLIVRVNPDIRSEVILLLDIDVRKFYYGQLINLIKRLEILLGDSFRINILRQYYRFMDKKVLLKFTVSNQQRLLGAPEVVRKLREKLRTDRSLITPEVLDVNPVLCQNECSKHGECDEYTKKCVCEPFWMENFIRLYYGDQEPNCDWSILYVTIIFTVICISICSVFWCLIGLALNAWRAQRSFESRVRFSRHGRKLAKKTRGLKYTLLNPDERDDSSDNTIKINKPRVRITPLNKAESNQPHPEEEDEEEDFEDANDPDSLVLSNMQRNQSTVVQTPDGDFTSLSPSLLSLSTSSDSDVTIFDSKQQINSTRNSHRTLHRKSSSNV